MAFRQTDTYTHSGTYRPCKNLDYMDQNAKLEGRLSMVIIFDYFFGKMEGLFLNVQQHDLRPN